MICCDGKCGECHYRVSELRNTFHEALIAARDQAVRQGWSFEPERHHCPACAANVANRRKGGAK